MLVGSCISATNCKYGCPEMPLILRRSVTQYVAMGVNKIVQVIPQYCTAHPVLRIITRNWQQNIMAAFLVFPCTWEKWAFWKGMVGKKSWKFVARKGKKAERKCWNHCKCKNTSFSNCEFPVTGRRVVEQVRWSFPLRRAWWPMFFTT